MNNNPSQSYQAGQLPANSPEQVSSYQPARVCGGTHQAAFVDGILSQRESTPETFKGADTSAFAGTSGFESTARNANGTPVTALLPTTLVTIGGVQAQVATFVAAGQLQKLADGTYAEAQAAPEVAPEDTSDILPMNPESMAAVNDALEPVPQHDLDGLAAIGVGVALGTIDPGALAHRFSSVTGLGGADVAQRVAFVQSAFQAMADHAVTSRSGIGAADLQDFWAWCKETRSGELRQAIQKQVSQHDVSGYAQLAARWQAVTPPTTQALQAAGYQVRNMGQQDEVFVSGAWVTPKAAARVRLI